MSETIVLEAQPRTIVGKQVKQLRAESLIPAVVYGPTLEAALQLQIPEKELQESLKAAGGTNLIEIRIGAQKVPVLVRDVQRAILSSDILHVDFYAADMNVKLRTEVPVIHVGESPIVKSGQAIIITEVNAVEVECFPNNIPSHLEIDLSSLIEIGAMLTVADLKAPADVEIVTDPEEILVRTDYAMALETEEEGAAMAVDAEAVEVINAARKRKKRTSLFLRIPTYPHPGRGHLPGCFYPCALPTNSCEGRNGDSYMPKPSS
jgi:large subunit ribosomal protein L25